MEAASFESDDQVVTVVSTDGWEVKIQPLQDTADELNDDVSDLIFVCTGSNPQADPNLYGSLPNRQWLHV